MNEENDDITKLWRAPVPDRLTKGCLWFVAFIVGTVVLLGILAISGIFKSQTHLPFGCTQKDTTPSGECP
jgi:hypothetical protein